eukprot:TRINITY_DN13501_c6_g1_i1.p1 TRINITY_DN13501_c6_g1~~TRINITY_DN13501_c6_g1_i1.p1  ORF type:complete len:256 (+),score=40.05 TRINITY_DN13501_c6_g1_i1:111-878(+)
MMFSSMILCTCASIAIAQTAAGLDEQLRSTQDQQLHLRPSAFLATSLKEGWTGEIFFDPLQTSALKTVPTAAPTPAPHHLHRLHGYLQRSLNRMYQMTMLWTILPIVPICLIGVICYGWSRELVRAFCAAKREAAQPLIAPISRKEKATRDKGRDCRHAAKVAKSSCKAVGHGFGHQRSDAILRETSEKEAASGQIPPTLNLGEAWVPEVKGKKESPKTLLGAQVDLGSSKCHDHNYDNHGECNYNTFEVTTAAY